MATQYTLAFNVKELSVNWQIRLIFLSRKTRDKQYDT